MFLFHIILPIRVSNDLKTFIDSIFLSANTSVSVLIFLSAKVSDTYFLAHHEVKVTFMKDIGLTLIKKI